jgi:hypothetical protein
MSQQPPYGPPPGNPGRPWQPPQQPGPPQQGQPHYPPPQYQQQYQQSYPPPQGYYPPPQKKGGLSGVALGCLIAAGIVIVGGALFVILFFAVLDHAAKVVSTAVATRESAVNAPFSRVATAGSAADVRVALANGATGTVTTVEQEQKTHRVTITGISNNAKSTNPVEQPHAGNRYYVLQVTVENIGANSINAGPWTLHTADGREFNQVIVTGVGDPPDSSSLAPGGKTAGYIIFEIPAAATVQWVRYDPNPYVKGDLYFDA